MKGKIEIDYYDKFQCLHLSWSGSVTQAEYTSMLCEMFRLAKQYKVCYLIFDAREEEDLLLYDPAWTFNLFKEEVSRHPVKKVARLASPDFHNETRMSTFATKMLIGLELPFEFKYLPDTNHALAWFLESDGKAEN